MRWEHTGFPRSGGTLYQCARRPPKSCHTTSELKYVRGSFLGHGSTTCAGSTHWQSKASSKPRTSSPAPCWPAVARTGMWRTADARLPLWSPEREAPDPQPVATGKGGEGGEGDLAQNIFLALPGTAWHCRTWTL